MGTFDSEDEAGIMYARARSKYPEQEQSLKACPLDLSEVPMGLPPIPSDRPPSKVPSFLYEGAELTPLPGQLSDDGQYPQPVRFGIHGSAGFVGFAFAVELN